jgi:hypothetical protein
MSLARVRWIEGWHGIGPRGAHGRASAWRLRGYTRAPTGLRQGLDGTLSTMSARPVGQAARGFVVELLVWHPGWSSDRRQQRSGDGTPQRTTTDTMAQGGRKTRGPPCGAWW